MKNFKDVEVPETLKHNTKDKRGYPIPWSAYTHENGNPDFTCLNLQRWDEAAKHNLCGLCGRKLLVEAWFIGGPHSFETRHFFDHPMHEECARYAIQVCPYLALTVYNYSKHLEAHQIPIPNASKVRPTKFGLMCSNYWICYLADKQIESAPWLRNEWWFEGKRLDTDVAVS